MSKYFIRIVHSGQKYDFIIDVQKCVFKFQLIQNSKKFIFNILQNVDVQK